MRSTTKTIGFRIAATLAVLIAPTVFADDPKQLGMCDSANKKVGDTCVLGVCTNGKQTVYKCDSQMRCMLRKDQQSCSEAKKNPEKTSN